MGGFFSGGVKGPLGGSTIVVPVTTVVNRIPVWGDTTGAELIDTIATIDTSGNISATNLSGSNTGDQDLSGYVLTSSLGAVSGVATLDGNGTLSSAQIPSITITDTFVVASQAAMLALTAFQGDIAIRSDTMDSFVLSAEPASTLSNWIMLLTPSSPVLSVNGYVGAVSLAASDVGLGNVTNVAQLPLSYLTTDGTLASNSDVLVASEKATKTYIDTRISAIGASEADFDQAFLTMGG